MTEPSRPEAAAPDEEALETAPSNPMSGDAELQNAVSDDADPQNEVSHNAVSPDAAADDAAAVDADHQQPEPVQEASTDPLGDADELTTEPTGETSNEASSDQSVEKRDAGDSTVDMGADDSLEEASEALPEPRAEDDDAAAEPSALPLEDSELPDPEVPEPETLDSEVPESAQPEFTERESTERGSPEREPAEREADAAASEKQTAPAQREAESGLSGFLDSLDERAKRWWAQRRARKAAHSEQVTAAAAEQKAQPALPAEDNNESAPEDASIEATEAFAAPEPVEPTEAAEPAEPNEPVEPDTADSPVADSPVAEDQPTDPDATATIPAYTQDIAPESDAESTTVLPAYREDYASPVGASAPPGTAVPVRIRKALDEHRRRDVILQKAAAIEAATAQNYQPPRYEFADEEEDLYTYIPPYNLPSRDPDPEPTAVDLYRRIFVSAGAAAAVASLMWMFGWFGTTPAVLSGNGLREHAEGWFSGERALLSPDHNMYWLWPILVIGLGTHAVFQWQSSQRSTPRQRRSGWLVGTASGLMLVITAAMHFGLFTLGTLAAIAVALTLLDAIRQFNLHTARNTTERRLTDGIIGLFFGFALVQAMSFISIWLTAHGWSIPGIPALLWALIGLFICVWTAAFYSMTERGRITIALGLGWGMFWLIFPRLLTEVTSVWVAIGAAMGAFIVILCTQSRRHRINHAERRAAMGRPLEDII